MQAIILAGGLGTRLRPSVSDVPKVMAPVAGRPFVDHLLRQLASAGVTSVVIAAGYRADQLVAHLGDGSEFGVELAWSVEAEPLGTAGALKLTEPLLEGDRWLVLNGDSYFDIPLADLAADHERSGARATIALAHAPEGDRYGAVEIDADGWITAFIEKGEGAGSGLINAGVYVIELSVLDLIPTDRPVSLEREVLPQLIGAGLRGIAFDAFFIDIGIPADYDRALISEPLRRLAP